MTLEQYRHHVADLEKNVERCRRLYEQTRSDLHRSMLKDAQERAYYARNYLKRREKKEARA